MMSHLNARKIAIVGCGFVGSSSAFALMQSGLCSEIALIDADRARADGEALDISHGAPFAHNVQVYAADYDDVMDAAIIVITAGAAQRPGETRLDLVNKNVAILRSILSEISSRDYQGILLLVSNPVDVLTTAAIRLSGLPENRVLGSGTVLDTARLKTELGRHLDVDARSVHSYIIGEHGDSELVAWSSANVSGVPLSDFCEMRGHYDHETAIREIAENVKNSAYEIIEKKRATYYGIAMSVVRICRAIVMNEHTILPVSSMMHGEYGIERIALSMPAIVGEEGIETQVPIVLSEQEQAQLVASARALQTIADEAL